MDGMGALRSKAWRAASELLSLDLIEGTCEDTGPLEPASTGFAVCARSTRSHGKDAMGSLFPSQCGLKAATASVVFCAGPANRCLPHGGTVGHQVFGSVSS